MPLFFQFLENFDPVSLDKVDREICEEFGERYSATNYCIQYQVITTMGLAILSRMKADPVTPEAFDQYVADNRDVYDEAEQNEKFKKFLCGKYQFTGWYQRHK